MIIEGRELDDLWAAVAREAGLQYAPSFLNREWEQVILAQDLRAEEEYLTASRAGQGTPLGKAQRRQVWALTQRAEAQLRGLGRDTFTQLANEAARALRDGAVKLPYRHVIIDEAQDLHPAQWRLLRAAVPAGPDDMFIVGDAHQRIYDNHVSLARVGINVRGRSQRLTVNYRTTQEILALAVPALGKASVTGLDDEADALTGYRSPAARAPPQDRRGADARDRYEALVRHVTAWRDDGIEPHAIGIAARSNWIGKDAAAALNAAGIRTVSLAAKSRKDAVRVGTMHGMKGLEFQAVAVIGVADGDGARAVSAGRRRRRPGRLRAGPAARTVPAVRRADPSPRPPLHLLQRFPERVPPLKDQNRSARTVPCSDHLHISYSGSRARFCLS